MAVLAAGWYHTCAVGAGDLAYCWGINVFGQLGNGDSVTTAVPVAVSGGRSFVTIAGGALHTCGVTTAGAAYCWGRNIEGQLGIGSTERRHVPTEVVTDARFVAITAGAAHTCGVTTDHSTLCWGDNRFGQLGDGSTGSSTTPISVPASIPFVLVTAGQGHTCALTAEGTPYCWGRNHTGQLGRGWRGSLPLDTLDSHPRPVARGRRFLQDVRFRHLDAGLNHVCGVTTDDDGFCWGDDIHGALGWNYGGELASGPRGAPVRVEGGVPFQSVAAGGRHTCGVSVAGVAHCWGYNFSGQVGSLDRTEYRSNTVPYAVSGATVFVAVTGGWDHTCGIDTAGVVYCWGNNEAGQAGAAATDSCGGPTLAHPCGRTPTRVDGLPPR